MKAFPSLENIHLHPTLSFCQGCVLLLEVLTEIGIVRFVRGFLQACNEFIKFELEREREEGCVQKDEFNTTILASSPELCVKERFLSFLGQRFWREILSGFFILVLVFFLFAFLFLFFFVFADDSQRGGTVPLVRGRG